MAVIGFKRAEKEGESEASRLKSVTFSLFPSSGCSTSPEQNSKTRGDVEVERKKNSRVTFD
jgi:hypothetical protein